MHDGHDSTREPLRLQPYRFRVHSLIGNSERIICNLMMNHTGRKLREMCIMLHDIMYSGSTARMKSLRQPHCRSDFVARAEYYNYYTSN